MDGLAIGRIVHYVDAATGTHHAAVITGIDTNDVNVPVVEVSLLIMRRDGISVEVAVPYDDGGGDLYGPNRDTWHWPEKV